MHFTYYRGKSTITGIVKFVCRILWNILKSLELPKITTELMEQIAQEYEKKTNFPNCIGALDGKHIRILSPDHSGSLFFNYKNYNSIVLLALVDTNYKFIYVDIGAYGKECDSTVFQNSNLYDLLKKGQLSIPPPKPLPGFQKEIPFVFVADEGLPLTNNIMRPYSGKFLSIEKRVFNYRLSRARRYVESAFGILANKWRIFHRPINVSYDFTIDIIKACCVLLNFVLNRDGAQTFEEMIIDDSLQILHETTLESGTGANIIRNEFCNYFNSNIGGLSWQLTKI